MDHILDHISFSALEHADQEAVRQLFDNTYQSGSKLKLDQLGLFKKRKSLPISSDFYSKKLETVNEVSFHYMDSAQKTAMQQDLLFTFYLLSAQYQLTELNLYGADSQRDKLRNLGDQIKRSARLIKELRKADQPEMPETILASATDDDSEKHARYLGLTMIAPLVVEGGLMELQVNAGYLNGVRGQWSRTRGIFKSILAQLSDKIVNRQQMQQRDAIPTVITGYISWILYYTNFAIDLHLLLRHTFRGKWMNQAERDLPISTRERFQAQWDQRKFSLLGNLNWAIGYMVCFYWLTGSGMAGYVGNLLTVSCLLVDISLAAWRFSEESKEHKADLERYGEDIKTIQRIFDTTEDKEQKKILQFQLNTVVEAEKKCKLDWKYKKYRLIADITYAVNLTITFSLVFCFLFPPTIIPVALATTLGLAGSVLYFVQNLVYGIVVKNLDGAKTRETKVLAKTELSKLLSQFGDLKSVPENDLDGSKKQRLYLEMKQLSSELDYQKQLEHYQMLKLIRKVLVQTFAPSLVFGVYMFTPIGLSIAVLAAVIGLAILSNSLLAKTGASKLPTLDKTKYDSFLKLEAPTQDDLKSEEKPVSAQNKSRFFTGTTSISQPAPLSPIELTTDLDLT